MADGIAGNVAVRRSAEDLLVECKKDGNPDGFLRAVSRAAGGMWGNIILGGGIGAIIDHNKGTGYDYPNDLPVKMGASITIDKRDEQKPPAAAAAEGTTAKRDRAARSFAERILFIARRRTKFRIEDGEQLKHHA